MKVLNWEKPVEFTEADRLLIQKALTGELKYAVKNTYIDGDFYQKYDENTGEKIPKKPHQILVPDKTARCNWGDIRRALIRGFKTGDIVSYRLMKNGELVVKWFVKFTHREPIPIKLRSEPEPIIKSTITIDEHKNDIRLPAPKYLSNRRNRSFIPYDAALSRVEAEANLAADHKYLHSLEAQKERAETFRSEDHPCKNWCLKFKTRYGHQSGIVLYRTSEEVLAANRKNKE